MVGYKKFFDIKKVAREINDYLAGFDKERFLKAYEFAENAHKDQIRKDGKTPYIAHPVETVKILMTLHADEDTLISALLHDVPEDTKYTLENIEKLFGKSVAFLVDGITKLSKVHYQHSMPERQVESLKKLLLHSAEDMRVILIKLADRLHNMETLNNIPQIEKRVRIATETLEIYVPIANLLGIRVLKSKLEELCFMHLFPPEYQLIKNKCEDTEKSRTAAYKKFKKIIEDLVAEQNIEVIIQEREKSLYTVYKKMRSLGKDFDYIDERISIKILTNNVEQCYLVLGLLHGQFIPKVGKFKDNIANPKINGYQSLHTTVFGINGRLTEIQLRTKDMDLDANFGVAADFFRDGLEKDRNLGRSQWLKKILEIEKSEGENNEFLRDLKSDILQERMTVFTPKGDAIDLPRGASVIDMAYAIHTEIGASASRADINGKERPITTILEPGDVVKVLVSKQASPELAWLDFVKTNFARNKILNHLKSFTEARKIQEGKRILQKEFDIYGLGLCENINFRKLSKNLRKHLQLTFSNLDQVLAAVGSGDLKAVDVVRHTYGNYKYINRFLNKKSGESEDDRIKVHVKVVAKDRFGLLREISEVLYKRASDIYTFKGWTPKSDENAYFTVTVAMDGVEEIRPMFDELERVEGVSHVYRISYKGLVLFYLMMVLGVVLWVVHPYILDAALSSNSAIVSPMEVNFIMTLGLFGLFLLMVYLTGIVRKYFPIIRNKKRFWILSFLVPVIAVATLGLEVFLAKLQLSWTMVFLETMIIYTYLGMSFLSYKKSTKKI